VRAFTKSLAPVTIGQLLCTSCELTDPVRTHRVALPLVAGAVLLLLGAKLSPLWPIAIGAVACLLGLV
jgi:hypothetical protein